MACPPVVQQEFSVKIVGWIMELREGVQVVASGPVLHSVSWMWAVYFLGSPELVWP